MKILISDDELYNRLVLEKILSPYGVCDQTINGLEAVDAFHIALFDGTPYDLICLDMMMPELDGLGVLRQIRLLEQEVGIKAEERAKVFIVSAMDPEELEEMNFIPDDYTDYLAKPIDQKHVFNKLKGHGLI
ncbi:MAG: response regulator [Magnetococcus sp. DMHC-6]